MICQQFFFVLLALSSLWGTPPGGQAAFGQRKQKWTYTFLRMNVINSNIEFYEIQGTVEPIRRGLYGFSGFFYIHPDALDENLKSEIRLLYNSRNNNNFQMTPMRMPSMDPLKFLNTFYRQHVMEPLRNCSNAPQSDTPWESLENIARNFTFNKCLVDTQSFPPAMRPGYYMVRTIISRSVPPLVNCTTEFLVQVESTTD